MGDSQLNFFNKALSNAAEDLAVVTEALATAITRLESEHEILENLAPDSPNLYEQLAVVTTLLSATTALGILDVNDEVETSAGECQQKIAQL